MFLHTFEPSSILINLGFITIYWYGLFIVLGIISAMFITVKIAKKYSITKETILDLSFWLIINGVIGARIYDVLLEHNYYLNHPFDIFKIWQGGLAIHGSIIAGFITIFYFARKQNINFIQLASIVAPGLALGQSIGRWGNYFNQELFGLPSNLPWSIPIDQTLRPINYYNSTYFHPTFLYESIGNFFIFIFLLFINYKISSKNNKEQYKHILLITYLAGYSILRFCLEFVRIDFAPTVFGWRWPQITSALILLVIIVMALPKLKKHANNI